MQKMVVGSDGIVYRPLKCVIVYILATWDQS